MRDGLALVRACLRVEPRLPRLEAHPKHKKTEARPESHGGTDFGYLDASAKRENR